MTKLKDLAYDIEQLYIEGLHPTKIAKELGCPLGLVYDWLEQENVVDDSTFPDAYPFRDEYSPYNTSNS